MQKNNYEKGLGRSAIGAIFCSLTLLTSMATAINILNSNEPEVIDSLSYTFLFEKPTAKLCEINSQDFTIVEMKGCIGIGKTAGEPMLPTKAISMLLPPMKTISSINVVGTPVKMEIISIDLSDKPVFPYQNPVPFGSEPEDFVISESLYTKDINYPGNLKEDYLIGYSHGYKILNVKLNPIQYNPAKGEINYYPEMTVEIELEDNSEMNRFYRNSPEDQEYVKGLVCNHEIFETYEPIVATSTYEGGLCDPSDNYDYVIITTETNGLDYWDTTTQIPYNWEDLMDKHESDDGLSCTLVTVQDIYACSDYDNSNQIFNDEEAHIREFVRDAYEDWGTSYVLIGGDDENQYIPAREMETNYEGWIDSDLYWSNLDYTFNDDQDNYWGEEGDTGFDLYSEIFIGRLTCDEPIDVSNWMTKSFYYADCIEPEFLECAGFYGGNTGWSCQGDDFMDYSAIKGTDDWLGPNPHADGPFPTWAGFQWGFETWNLNHQENQYNIDEMWTAEPRNPGWQGGSTSAAIAGFRNAINNNKVAIASGIAHASSSSSLDVYYNSWESDYHNTKPFFLHDYGCHCGDMDASDDGVLHSMLFHDDEELAFAVVYNTCYGWGNSDCTNSSSAFQAKEFWSYLLDMDNKSGDFSNWQLGIAHAYSKDRMAPTILWDYSYGTWRAIIQGCLLFGDPAQQIKTPRPSEKPAQPNPPAGPDEWIIDVECDFTGSTTDPEGEQLYYLFDWGDGNYSGWVGPYNSGQTASASYAWSELGEYYIRVKAKDIWGVGSDWSEVTILYIVLNENPDRPLISGKNIGFGGVEYSFTFQSSDPDGHDIYYSIDWDDGDSTGWLGPYNSGEQITLFHSWNKKGEYWVKAWSKDALEGESTQASHKINILTDKNKQIYPGFSQLLEILISRFPLIAKIIQNL
jgi:hypothetical protein